MKNALSSSVCCFLLLGALLAGRTTAQAQSIVAGQSNSATYVDLVPDKVITAQKPSSAVVRDSLDLDLDGRFDLRLTSYLASGSFPTSGESQVMPMHYDVEIYSSSSSPAISPFATGALVHEFAPGYNTTPGHRWSNPSTVFNTPWLIRDSKDPANGYQSMGLWTSGQDGYLGVRLRASSGWRYGWVRMKAEGSSSVNRVSMTVKDFALANPVLAQQPARNTAWQLYPVPATDWLTVQAPGVTAAQLTVRDLTGRVCLRQQLGTTGQLSVAALPAGVYLLQVQTATENVTRQFAKQ